MWRSLQDRVCCSAEKLGAYSAESVEGTSLALQSVDDIHNGDSLPHGMLGVGGCIPDYLQEDLQDTAGFLEDGSGDTLWQLTPHFPRPLPFFTTSRHSD